jgi:hypothetical protein
MSVVSVDEAPALLREWANLHQRKAHELAMLAHKIEELPEGVRVATQFDPYTLAMTATFVGPPVAPIPQPEAKSCGEARVPSDFPA